MCVVDPRMHGFVDHCVFACLCVREDPSVDPCVSACVDDHVDVNVSCLLGVCVCVCVCVCAFVCVGVCVWLAWVINGCVSCRVWIESDVHLAVSTCINVWALLCVGARVRVDQQAFPECVCLCLFPCDSLHTRASGSCARHPP